MSSTITDVLSGSGVGTNPADVVTGIASQAAVKAPCVVASQANLTLSGEQTVDGVSVTDGDRVLVQAQTDGSENGIYIVSTGDWSRAPDFDGTRDVTTGTMVLVYSGSTGVYLYRLTTTGTITIGSTSLSFTGMYVSGLTELSDDTSPQLGGNLDVNGNGITFSGATVTDVTGADTGLVSGTTGTSGNLVQWNGDGDAVDSSIAASDVLVDSDIDSTVQGYDADTAKLDTAQEWTGRQNFNQTALTSSSGAVAWDVSSNQVAGITLTENVTFSAPTNMPAGSYFSVAITQHASAAKTVAWNAAYLGSITTMTTDTGKTMVYVFYSPDGSKAIFMGASGAVTL